MAEIRHDAHSDRTTIFATNRQCRPLVFGDAALDRCPFCAGNERDTPAAVAHFGAATHGSDDAGWRVRVVPNKYPAVQQLDAAEQSPQGDSCCRGIHEVIVESREHLVSFSELTADDAQLVFRAYRDRLLRCSNIRDIAYAQIFKNVGAAAGASVEHGHSQLLGLTAVPLTLLQELTASQEHHQRHNQYLHQALIEDARQRQSVVCETEHFIAFCPRVPRFALETWIMPHRHAPRFEDSEACVLDDAAILLQDIIHRVELLYPQIAYNCLLHTAPFDTNQYHHYHWHIEFFPRLEKAAGFEWATGWFLNTMTPEAAAQRLRNAK